MSDEKNPNTNDPIDVGNSIAKSNEVASKGPIGYLLNPTAKRLGIALDNWIQSWGTRKQEKAADHVNNVLDKNSDEDLEGQTPNPADMARWLELSSEAGDILEDDAKWSAVLESILKNDSDTKKLLQVATELEREHIVAILFLGEHDLKKSDNLEYQHDIWETLHRLGLTSPNVRWKTRQQKKMVIILAYFLLLFSVFSFFLTNPRYSLVFLDLSVIWPAFPTLAAFGIVAGYFSHARNQNDPKKQWQLTPLGNRLSANLAKYYSAETNRTE